LDLTFNEQALSGFAPDEVSGFHQGDLIMPVVMERYFVDADGHGGTALFVQSGTVGNDPKSYPVAAGTPRLVQEDIEDLQLAVGVDDTESGNPDSIRWSFGLPAAFKRGVKSVRVSVVATSARTILNTDGQIQRSAQYVPMSIEDHTVAAGGVPDGHRRTLYTRRVELPNLSAGDL
jgi:hypothetical protein